MISACKPTPFEDPVFSGVPESASSGRRISPGERHGFVKSEADPFVDFVRLLGGNVATRPGGGNHLDGPAFRAFLPKPSNAQLFARAGDFFAAGFLVAAAVFLAGFLAAGALVALALAPLAALRGGALRREREPPASARASMRPTASSRVTVSGVLSPVSVALTPAWLT